MAKTKKRISSESNGAKVSRVQNWRFPLEKQNIMLFGIGLLTILIGYALMTTGLGGESAAVEGKWNNSLAVNIAPIILVIGYCVIIPYSIYKYFGSTTSEQE